MLRLSLLRTTEAATQGSGQLRAAQVAQLAIDKVDALFIGLISFLGLRLC